MNLDAQDAWSRLGIVVIGRNEGDRLIEALAALAPSGRPLVYVDSNSADMSVQHALEVRAIVVQLKQGPYCAARARQVGVLELLRHAPNTEFVQFVDGDCVIDDRWLTTGLEFLVAHERTAAISGKWREEFPDANIYHSIVNLDWIEPAGFVDSTGGNMMCRREALFQVGGWDGELIAGEDADLGFRLSDAGWEIQRIGAPMALHDVRMSSFRSYWRRCVRSGYCYLEVAWRRRRGTGRRWLTHVRSAIAYALVLPILICSGMLLTWWLSPGWWGPILIAGAFLFYARMLLAASRSALRKGASRRIALLYAVFMLISKFANLWGLALLGINRLRGTRMQIIEHKASL